MMCPAGYALIQTLLAWSFATGAWVQVDLCHDEDTMRGIVIRNDTRKEVDIYQVTLNDKSFWVIEENKDCK